MTLHDFPSGSVADRRRVPRQRTLISGTLRESNRMTTWSATIRNLSEEGARIEVANAFWIPNSFELEISARDMRRPAEVIWRNGTLLGVAFRPAPATCGKQAEDQLSTLRLEREYLRRRVSQLSE